MVAWGFFSQNLPKIYMDVFGEHIIEMILILCMQSKKSKYM